MIQTSPKFNAAIKYLSENHDAGVMTVNNEVVDKLREKHPPRGDIAANSLLNGPLPQTPASYFDNINESTIRKAASLTKGAAGPSKLDAEQFKIMLVSNKFRKEGQDLRENIAIMAKKLATQIVDLATLEAYTACNLIPLDKGGEKLDVRPIGVGEVLRRIIRKVISWTLKDDIQLAAGPLQTATGLESGAEAAIHAMKEIFDDAECEAVILVDATNAFNTLNRKVALHNIQYICPPFSNILINTYRNSSRLIISCEREILSQEGTTQGDTLAMQFYALGTVLIQLRLRTVKVVKEVWLADDATSGGKLGPLKQWWDIVIEEGAKFGYHVNESKSWIILKDESKLEQAQRLFSNSAIKFTTEGKRHLGAALGTSSFREE